MLLNFRFFASSNSSQAASASLPYKFNSIIFRCCWLFFVSIQYCSNGITMVEQQQLRTSNSRLEVVRSTISMGSAVAYRHNAESFFFTWNSLLLDSQCWLFREFLNCSGWQSSTRVGSSASKCLKKLKNSRLNETRAPAYVNFNLL